MLSLTDIDTLTAGRLGRHDVPCSECGPGRDDPKNRRRKVLRIWRNEPGFATFACARCGLKGHARNDGVDNLSTPSRIVFQNDQQSGGEADASRRRDRARWLWSRRRRVEGTAAAAYLRWRGYQGPLPATMGFLPARGDHPPALISAFGIPEEPEPGQLLVDDGNVTGIHLIRLTPEGRKADAEPVKLMIGSCKGSPIVLAPMNDLLGLAVVEGIETGLSVLQATGLGVWCAGSASFMPALADAVPPYADCVTICGEPDPAGRKGAIELAERLDHRGIRAELRFLDGEAAA